MRLPGVEPGSIAWKAIILTVGLQTPIWWKRAGCASKHILTLNNFPLSKTHHVQF